MHEVNDTHDKYLVFESANNKIKLEDNLDLISKYKKIHFDYEFNLNIDLLANFDIEEIYFGGGDHWCWYPTSKFNQPVNNLPPTLKKLYFYSNSKFNQLIDNLPNGLISLSLGSDFDKTIDYLPTSLEILYINSTSKLNFNNLPNSIKEIFLYDTAENIELKYIPGSVKKITLYDNNKNLSSLPNNINNQVIIIKSYKELERHRRIMSGM